MRTPEDRFWSKVEKTDDHWLWTGGLTSKGYGSFWVRDGVWTRAHQFAWADAGLVVPEGLELDHLCRVRTCVRIEHLRVTTHSENLKNRAPWKTRAPAQTSCSKGHPYEYFTPSGKPRCRVCRAENERIRRSASR